MRDRIYAYFLFTLQLAKPKKRRIPNLGFFELWGRFGEEFLKSLKLL